MHFHQLIHKYLIEYRTKFDSNFNFLVRQNSSENDKKYPGGKFAHGIVFQGTDNYCFVALIDKSGGVNATKSVGINIKPTKTNSFKAIFDIVFPGIDDENLITFYKDLASKFTGIQWDSKGTRAYLQIGEFPEDDPSLLYSWLDDNYSTIRETAMATSIDNLLPDEHRFNTLQEKLKKKLSEVSLPINYWVFQGNPDIYNITNALKAGHIKSWKVAAHKDKIKIGDKVILWQTGKEAGCYALGVVTSEVGYFEEESFEKSYYVGKGLYQKDLRVRLKITDYTAGNPILWNDIKNEIAFSDFNAGNQGTNFSATQLEFETLLKHINRQDAAVKAKRILNTPLAMTALNQILYGPPGTGKTFKLQRDYFEKFTIRESNLSRSQYLENFVLDFTWWQVIAMAVLDLKLAITGSILEHELIIAKTKSSTSKNVRPIIWSSLQSHTIRSCENVNVVQRIDPLIFTKDANSKWSVSKSDLEELYPEAVDQLSSIKNFVPSDDKVVKNYELVTFHQSFTYEDFVEGIKPVLEDDNAELRYEISDGVFKRLATLAKNNPSQPYAIFIDEINRGNVASIFGELITLIEKDKRDGAENELSVVLPYSKQLFSVPSNLHIIGTMNTADRSIEALDSALRRRFEFVEMLPNYSVIDEVLNHQSYGGHKLSTILETINNRITLLIDRDHQIGHSYFLKLKNSTNLEHDLLSVFKNSIIPLLQEYFFNDYIKIAMVIGEGFMDKDRYSKVRFAQNDGDYDSDYSDFVKYEIKTNVDLKEAIAQLMGTSNA